MLLKKLITAVQPKKVYGKQGLEITNIANNSKEVKPNGLFICIYGFKQDGHAYVDEAIKRGAVAIITEQKLALPVTQLLVDNSRLAQALVCQSFYNYPTESFKLVGITGTNGKTTISFLAEAILSEARLRTGLIGTIKYKINDHIFPAVHTTPDTLSLGKLFKEINDNKVEAAVMEVSSHALELDRVTGCEFDITVFSNITRDHFEFHRNFKNYLSSKSKLFLNQSLWGRKKPEQRYAVINTDDPYSDAILKITSAKNVITYGLYTNPTVKMLDYELNNNKSVFQVRIDGNVTTFTLNIPGLFNVYNALAAIAIGLCFDIDISVIKHAISRFKGIPGRCEYILCGQKFHVLVDFAHNPSGLYNLLSSIPFPNSKYKKILVFGCEGGKDQGKRSLMGSIAAKYSDYCIITTDNIYQEEPMDVAQDIEQGVVWGGMNSSSYRIILDRYQAIKYAFEIARPGDTVIIAGKGHESTQIINGKVFPFDDRLVAKKLLSHNDS